MYFVVQVLDVYVYVVEICEWCGVGDCGVVDVVVGEIVVVVLCCVLSFFNDC